PGGAVADRKHVEMAVQDQVPAAAGAAGETGDQIRRGWLRRFDAVRDALGVEELAEQVGRLRGVARRIAGVDAREGAQEVELAVALGVEPMQQPRVRAHGLATLGTAASGTTTPSLTTARHDAPPIA